jgi:hypothetical protein
VPAHVPLHYRRQQHQQPQQQQVTCRRRVHLHYRARKSAAKQARCLARARRPSRSSSCGSSSRRSHARPPRTHPHLLSQCVRISRCCLAMTTMKLLPCRHQQHQRRQRRATSRARQPRALLCSHSHRCHTHSNSNRHNNRVRSVRQRRSSSSSNSSSRRHISNKARVFKRLTKLMCRQRHYSTAKQVCVKTLVGTSPKCAHRQQTFRQ